MYVCINIVTIYCSAGPGVTRCDLSGRVLSGMSVMSRRIVMTFVTLYREHVRGAVLGGSSELGFEEKTYVKVLTQRAYKCFCVMPMLMCDSNIYCNSRRMPV